MTNKGSFNINKLCSFASSNDIILIGEYANVTRDTIISGICKNINCNKNFIKNFRSLIKNNSFYCDYCMVKIKVEKRKKTHIKNCGFTTNLKCSLTKDKRKSVEKSK